ncbi:MAG: carboxymuconolactone decarboxylase family protein [Cellulomonas iranensis]|uniref:carboxymuconolactone decarboxylase family protein n=1 Tax=Cellulomonas iranensis TaxID=76862 RepID=UPI001AFFD9A6|nr:carboxymuconolactone decarboxylase family protein [Cellulomonas iranensis]MBO9570096.1 carboxymuconolactone decarboxylase family protein [Cellulomonas iranensis]
MSVSEAFQAFARETPEQFGVWVRAVGELGDASALDERTQELAYLAVLAATGLHSGLDFHTRRAIELGASRDEVLSAVLVGLPAAGNRVTSALPSVLAACPARDDITDSDDSTGPEGTTEPSPA